MDPPTYPFEETSFMDGPYDEFVPFLGEFKDTNKSFWNYLTFINMEITFNDVCETHQQKLFEIHG